LTNVQMNEMILVLTIFEIFFESRAWNCISHCRESIGCNMDHFYILKPLHLKYFVESSNFFNLYFTTILCFFRSNFLVQRLEFMKHVIHQKKSQKIKLSFSVSSKIENFINVNVIFGNFIVFWISFDELHASWTLVFVPKNWT